MAEELRQEYLQKHMGKTVEVLIEEEKGGLFAGHTPNYLKVYAKGENLHNRLCQVQITDVCKDGVCGQIV